MSMRGASFLFLDPPGHSCHSFANICQLELQLASTGVRHLLLLVQFVLQCLGELADDLRGQQPFPQAGQHSAFELVDPDRCIRAGLP